MTCAKVRETMSTTSTSMLLSSRNRSIAITTLNFIHKETTTRTTNSLHMKKNSNTLISDPISDKTLKTIVAAFLLGLIILVATSFHKPPKSK